MSNDVDEDASLAYALSLQDYFDQMSISPQNPSYDNDYQFALQLQAELEKSQSYPDPGKWTASQSTNVSQVTRSDEEYARILQTEENNSAGPVPTNDKGWNIGLNVSAGYGANSAYGIISPPVSPMQSPTTFSFSPQPYQVQNGPGQWTSTYPTPVTSPQPPPGAWNGTITVNIPPMPEIPPPPKTINDAALARIVQQEEAVVASDAEIAKRLQEEYDQHQLTFTTTPLTSPTADTSASSAPQIPVPAFHQYITPSPSVGETVATTHPHPIPPIPMVGPLIDPSPMPQPLNQTALRTLPQAAIPAPIITAQISPTPYQPLHAADEEIIPWFYTIATISAPCSSCKTLLTPLTLSTQTSHQTIHCNCPNCKVSICIACMQPGCQSTCGDHPETCQNLSHCANSRVMLLYRLFSSLDKFYITEREEQKAKNNNRTNTPKAQGNGIGFGSGFPGYNPAQYHIPRPEPPQPTTEVQPSRRDEQLKSFFRGVGWILYGFMGEKGIMELLRLSLLASSVEELLRNDSIMDCCERASLYAAFLTGLEGIGRHPLLSAGFFGRRDGVEYTDGIEKIVKGEGKFVRGKGETPLLAIMEKLGKQAETFSKTAGKVSTGLNTADVNVVNSINFSRSILNVQQLLQATSARPSQLASQLAIPPTSTPPNTASSNLEAYRLACAALAYDEFPPNATNIPYHYYTDSTTPTNVDPKRTLTLAKELSTMATSLPPGIFVRSLPNRPDCIKALIAAPEGTPYTGGLWEFDIFATGQYPAVPPKVFMCTTANGRVRFNPNLYADGKVCLSLIGTWPGSPSEQWQPYKSTIMQILISIQSMLFTSRPYFNEPETGAARDSQISLKYDVEVRLQTVRVAICDWMVPSNATSLWKDVIKLHFGYWGDQIRRNIMAYASSDPRIRNYKSSSMRNCGEVHLANVSVTGSGGISPMVSVGGGVTWGVGGSGSTGQGTWGAPTPTVVMVPSFGMGYGVTNNYNAPSEDLVYRFEQGLETIKAW